MNRQSLLRAFALCAIGFLTVAANAAAAEGEVARSVIEDGRQQYMSLCASCHGESGKGDGPMAPELTAKLADLTQIARQNKGKFPFWHVFDTIDGRTILRAHGGAEMPVWGSRSEAFYGRIPTREWMLAVTFYIESIQEK